MRLAAPPRRKNRTLRMVEQMAWGFRTLRKMAPKLHLMGHSQLSPSLAKPLKAPE